MSQSRARDAWGALRLAPWRFLFSSWPWRALLYLGTSALLAFVLIPVVLLTLVFIPLWGMAFGSLERRRPRLLGFPRVERAHVPLRWDQRWVWLGVRLGEPVTWREVANLLVGLVLGLLSLGLLIAAGIGFFVPVALMVEATRRPLAINLFGNFWIVAEPQHLVLAVLIALATVVLFAYVATVLASTQASISRALLSPRQEELEQQVARLTLSRASLLEAFEAERRRIERDLHDGAQQQLVALSMTLGLAELELADVATRGIEISAARGAVSRAHGQAESALASLRETVRGIHPQVLVDHGLAAAVGELLGRLPLDVTVAIDLHDRLPPAIEASAYFAVSESLTNVVRHASAAHASVAAGAEGGRFWLMVSDDGVGGANPSAGSGLAGLRERTEVLGGIFELSSPPGGPTAVRMSIPLR